MTESCSLHNLLVQSARKHPDRIAVIDPDRGSATYSELDRLTDSLMENLLGTGLREGDRVGICAPKSIGGIASIFAILKAKAAYVPVDSTAPMQRSALIFQDCTVKAIIVHRPLLDGIRGEYSKAGLVLQEVREWLDPFGCDLVLLSLNGSAVAGGPETDRVESLAYILYTSGSTGKPKGVMHTHASSLSFVDWCSYEFEPSADDRFSSHAPFHFDLSILDIFVPIKHGGSIVLISEDLGKQPLGLAEIIAKQKISVWYSTPSILRLLVEFGKLPQRNYKKLRLVLFAGEVFPIKHLQALQKIWSWPRYYNLYGPTETNVCTYYEVADTLPDGHTNPLPIGVACSGDRIRVVDENAHDVILGDKGELLVSGGSVMVGYWNLAEQNNRAHITDESGNRWYRTGDIVTEDVGGNYTYVGRRDRMVKRRGYRVELGEIEAALYSHVDVSEVAVVALADEESGVKLHAFISWSGDDVASQIALKRFSSENMPSYMIPDVFEFLQALPKTSTDKIDYQRLKESC